MRDPIDPVEKALRRQRQSRQKKRPLPNRARSTSRRGKPDPRPPATFLSTPDASRPSDQLTLAAVVTRIASMPHTAQMVQLSDEVRLDVANQLIASDPDAQERFGDAETLAAFLLSLARRSILHR